MNKVKKVLMTMFGLLMTYSRCSGPACNPKVNLNQTKAKRKSGG